MTQLSTPGLRRWCGLALLIALASTARAQSPAPNPDLAPGCPLKVALLLDESGSIGSSEAEVASAVNGFISALVGANVELAVIEFAEGANQVNLQGTTAFAPITAGTVGDVATYFAGTGPSADPTSYDPSGRTNWPAALNLARAISGGPADLVVMFTDGRPLVFGQSSAQALQNSIIAANGVKSDGSHVFVVGVGSLTVSNIVDISGPDQAGPGNTLATADYTVDDFSTLFTCFQNIAAGLLTTFYLDADGDGVGTPVSQVTQCDPLANYVPAANGIDNCPSTPNADQADDDGDGVGNVCDNCPADANAAQDDADGDGIGDACDVCPNDPTNDADGDGICGLADNCPDVANADQADADGDGAGDACDVCPNDPDDDADGDGVCGDVDNCPAVANADQADADGDGAGDVCDACPNDPDDDIDGDGLCADADNCPMVANADQADKDFDGIGDACDPLLDACAVLSALMADVEGYGLKRGLENALLTKLSGALAAFQNGGTNNVVGKLGAFVNQVQAKRGKDIDPATADAWSATAQCVIDAILAGATECSGGSSRAAQPGFAWSNAVLEDDVTVSPNPSDGRFAVTVPELAPDARVTFVVTELLGRELLRREHTVPAGLLRVELDVTGLASGLAQLLVLADGEPVATELIRIE